MGRQGLKEMARELFGSGGVPVWVWGVLPQLLDPGDAGNMAWLGFCVSPMQ